MLAQQFAIELQSEVALSGETCLEASQEKEILHGKRKKEEKKKGKRTIWLNLGSRLSYKILPLTSSSWQRV